MDFSKIKTLSIVGNGPVSVTDAAQIDAADLVLRFNSAPACGAAGQRVDILLLNRARVYMSKRINPLAIQRASEIWVNDVKESGQVDWHLERECKPRYLGREPTERARKYLAQYDAEQATNPTTGASIIAEILDTRPEIRIHLFGFTHQGRQQTHDWSAEKRWIKDLSDSDTITHYTSPGSPAMRNLVTNAEYLFRLAEKRAKHYVFNRLLHSDRSTKNRVLGRSS